MLCTVICTLTTNWVQVKLLAFAKFEGLTAAPKRMCGLRAIPEISMGRFAPIFMDHSLSKRRKRLNQWCGVTSQKTGIQTTRYFYLLFFGITKIDFEIHCTVFNSGVHKFRPRGRWRLISVHSQYRDFLHISLMDPRILRWLLHLWKISGILS
jgi:hypothetical protein